jgi:hypothetical protein
MFLHLWETSQFFLDFFGNGLLSFSAKTWISDKSGAAGGMKVSKPPKHIDCITRLLRFDSEFDATLLPLKLT